MNSKKNNSVVYLALLCFLYFLITSNYLPLLSTENNLIEEDFFYIEILEDGISTVEILPSNQDLSGIKTKYSLSQDIESGDKITVDHNEILVTKMTGRKRISLGIPIEINTATSEDLKAIPGIGEELAYRIISFRENIGDFESLDELDSIDGIGKKKLRVIKNLMYAD